MGFFHDMNLLEQKLVKVISEQGPIRFRDFMQVALYDPQYGYYNTPRQKIGKDGDYYTSSSVHPLFGATLADAFVRLWQELGPPGEFNIIEIGAGPGHLAFDILSTLSSEYPQLFEQTKYLIAEISPIYRSRQAESTREFSDRVAWVTLEHLQKNPLTGIFFSNELVDALPVHQVRLRGGQLQERLVDFDGSRLVTLWREPSSPDLKRYLDEFGIELAEGQTAEINLDALGWLERVSQAIEQGVLITIDYGDTADHLYSLTRYDGTLRCFYRHALNDDPLSRIGEQDITASVNFSALIKRGQELGLETVELAGQSDWLIRAGLVERVMRLEQKGATPSEVLKARQALKTLLLPGCLSDNFRVLVQKKERHGTGKEDG